MNRKQRRAQHKLRKKLNKTGQIDEQLDPTYVDVWKAISRPKEEPQKLIPGVNCPPEFPDFTAKVHANSWHDRSELNELISVIQALSDKTASQRGWSWSRNWDCKYVQIRFDMRDGAFILTNQRGERINLEQLKWQYQFEEDRKASMSPAHGAPYGDSK